MEAKKLGVIGGMGPMATSMFLEKLILHTKANKDQDHIDTIILNHATMPDRTQAILNNTGEAFLIEVEKDIRLLEYAGVANIAIPCNTSHFYFDAMQEFTDIPIIHMVERTAEHIHQNFGAACKVAILATDGTIKSGTYSAACEKYELDYYIPNPTLQEKVMEIIYQYKAGILQKGELEKVIKYCLEEEQATCVILGCTELSCIEIPEEMKQYCVDPMDVLVKESIHLSGKEII